MAAGKPQGLQSVKNTWVTLEVGQYGVDELFVGQLDLCVIQAKFRNVEEA